MIFASANYLTGEGAKHLAGLKHLTTLYAGSWSTDEGLKDYATLQNLTALDLRLTRATEAGLDRSSKASSNNRRGLFR
jgi:hypothetical protein